MRAVAVRRLVEHACARGPLALLVELRGLPLFVGALLTSLRDSGKLHKYDGRWTLAERHPVAGPVAVTGLLRARIERLCAEGREVLGLIAVCGSRAEHALLARLVPDERLLSGLAELPAAGVPHGDVVGRLWYGVRHPLLAEVAYDLLPLAVRHRRQPRSPGARGRTRPASGEYWHRTCGARARSSTRRRRWTCCSRPPARRWPARPARRRSASCARRCAAAGGWRSSMCCLAGPGANGGSWPCTPSACAPAPPPARCTLWPTSSGGPPGGYADLCATPLSGRPPLALLTFIASGATPGDRHRDQVSHPHLISPRQGRAP